jgi:uncharacterized membrane protein YccF (DUF307 family)
VHACVTVRPVFARAATGRGVRLPAQLAVRRPADVQRDHVLMRLVLNIIWLVFAGIWMFVSYAVAALICFVLIITIPFGVAALRIGIFALWPFGRTVVKRADAGVGSAIGNVLWFVLCGWWLAIVHVVTGVLLCITIVGIPLGLANFKLIPVSLLPFGREIVTIEEAEAQGLAAAVAVPRNPS